VTALASEFPDIELSHMYVDNAAMQLVRNPKQVCFSSPPPLSLDVTHCTLAKHQEDILNVDLNFLYCCSLTQLSQTIFLVTYYLMKHQ
jgi:hypothetical protein